MKKIAKKRKPKPLYRQADLERLAGIVERLNYPNRLVKVRAENDMREFIASHGETNAGLMLAHLQSGDPMGDGPVLNGGAAALAQGVGHA